MSYGDRAGEAHSRDTKCTLHSEHFQCQPLLASHHSCPRINHKTGHFTKRANVRELTCVKGPLGIGQDLTHRDTKPEHINCRSSFVLENMLPLLKVITHIGLITKDTFGIIKGL